MQSQSFPVLRTTPSWFEVPPPLRPVQVKMKRSQGPDPDQRFGLISGESGFGQLSSMNPCSVGQKKLEPIPLAPLRAPAPGQAVALRDDNDGISP